MHECHHALIELHECHYAFMPPCVNATIHVVQLCINWSAAAPLHINATTHACNYTLIELHWCDYTLRFYRVVRPPLTKIGNWWATAASADLTYWLLSPGRSLLGVGDRVKNHLFCSNFLSNRSIGEMHRHSSVFDKNYKKTNGFCIIDAVLVAAR